MRNTIVLLVILAFLLGSCTAMAGASGCIPCFSSDSRSCAPAIPPSRQALQFTL